MKLNFPPFKKIMTDRPVDQQTNRHTNRQTNRPGYIWGIVSVPINNYSYLMQNRRCFGLDASDVYEKKLLFLSPIILHINIRPSSAWSVRFLATNKSGNFQTTRLPLSIAFGSICVYVCVCGHKIKMLI